MFIENKGKLTDQKIREMIRKYDKDISYIGEKAIHREHRDYIEVIGWNNSESIKIFKISDFYIDNISPEANKQYKKDMYHLFGDQYMKEFMKQKEKSIRKELKEFKGKYIKLFKGEEENTK